MSAEFRKRLSASCPSSEQLACGAASPAAWWTCRLPCARSRLEAVLAGARCRDIGPCHIPTARRFLWVGPVGAVAEGCTHRSGCWRGTGCGPPCRRNVREGMQWQLSRIRQALSGATLALGNADTPGPRAGPGCCPLCVTGGEGRHLACPRRQSTTTNCCLTAFRPSNSWCSLPFVLHGQTCRSASLTPCCPCPADSVAQTCRGCTGHSHGRCVSWIGFAGACACFRPCV